MNFLQKIKKNKKMMKSFSFIPQCLIQLICRLLGMRLEKIQNPFGIQKKINGMQIALKNVKIARLTEFLNFKSTVVSLM